MGKQVGFFVFLQLLRRHLMIPREGKAVHESIGRVAAVDAENARGLAVARVRDRHTLVSVPVQVIYDAGTPVPTAYPPDIRCAQRARDFVGADLKGRYPILGGALPLCGIISPRLRGEKLQTKMNELVEARITPAYAGKRNFVTSYYGKDGFARFLQKNVDANAILFVDKKKAAKLSAESSTQWLEQLKDYNSNVIIRKTHAKINFPQEKSVSAKGIGEKRYSMIGEKGKANDQTNALIEPIDTGLHWFVGNDGKLRLEISDASARINTEAFARAKEAFQKLQRGDFNVLTSDLDLTVKDVFQHDALFQLYPELPDVRVTVTDPGDDTLGLYSSRGRVTPAYAGKSRGAYAYPQAAWDHPRLRGEKLAQGNFSARC